MAVGILTAASEFTKQIYDDVTEKMYGHTAPMPGVTRRPEGLIVHSAGQGDSGYYVYDSGSRGRRSSASWTRSSALRSRK